MLAMRTDDHHSRRTHRQRHMWVVGLLGSAVGLLILIFVPQLKAISASLLLFAGFHIIGALIILISLYFGFARDLVRRLKRKDHPPQQ